MGLLQRIARLAFGGGGQRPTAADSRARTARFETLEPRRMLDADPVVAGITYLEGDAGTDDTPDHFEVTFQGGSPTTLLTQFVVNGDQDGSGHLSDGDMFFDVGSAPPGAGGHHAFVFDADRSSGVSADEIQSVHVSDDGLRLTVQVRNFTAGDRLAFTIDVDEIERDRVDKIASGVEFERTRFQATFEDAHYSFARRDLTIVHDLDEGGTQAQHGGVFYDEYDDLLAHGSEIAGPSLALPADNGSGAANRSDGAIDVYDLTPKPVTIAGRVYHDVDLDCQLDAGESGIGGVELSLERWDDQLGDYQAVATTHTSADGTYAFGTDLNLMPGRFRVVESQPADYLSVGAQVGSVEGLESGVVAMRSGHPNVLADIEIPLGDQHGVHYDFCEVRPASISGHVWHDRNDDGRMDSGEEPIADVLIQIQRISSRPGQNDPFAATPSIFVRTDGNGFYQADGLPPGLYEVIEINAYPPEADPLHGYLDGRDSIGRVAGIDNGVVSNDHFAQIDLAPGSEGSQYNFGELRPVSISGSVGLSTPAGRCVGPDDPAYRPIAGVTMQLYDNEGHLLATTSTDAEGHYAFAGLAPGLYSVVEVQPADLLNGRVSAGTVDGRTVGLASNGIRIDAIELRSGENGVRYDFCEKVPASLCGFVYHDRNDNGVRDPGEEGIGQVQIDLLDADGQRVAQTTTDAAGGYCFQGLRAGTYSVVEHQPSSFADGKDSLGTIDGQTDGQVQNDRLTQIDLLYGQRGEEYNFGELAAGRLEGRVWVEGPTLTTDDGAPPADYRDRGDGVFDPSVDRALVGVRMTLWRWEVVDGVATALPVTLADVLPGRYPHLSASDDAVYVLTGAHGEYRFDGLRPGNYLVVQSHPEGYLDANNYAGTTGGTTYNSPFDAGSAPSGLTQFWSGEQLLDTIHDIRVEAGGVSRENNFTEMQVLRTPEPPIVVPPTPLPSAVIPVPPLPPPGLGWLLAGAQPLAPTVVIGRGIMIGADTGPGAADFTWHLSVINGGDPRGDAQIAAARQGVWMNAAFADSWQWSRDDMQQVAWTIGRLADDQIPADSIGRFGMADGIALSGDWNGDGKDEIGVFWKGFWFIDINGNQLWDRDDLVAQLGTDADQPVVGDWDGDGKDDIGIYGPMWQNDPQAIAHEPGLPNPANRALYRPKNLPPDLDDATDGTRLLRLTSAGSSRADLIDHVFQFGDRAEVALSGDWNGSGIPAIGVFRDGLWTLDLNGNGRRDAEDAEVRFGQAGDLPIVGDFNGDGVDDLAVYRHGTWIIDSNGNRELDAQDRVFELGAAGDLPVAGDFDGDGIDEPALYHRGSTSRVAER